MLLQMGDSSSYDGACVRACFLWYKLLILLAWNIPCFPDFFRASLLLLLCFLFTLTALKHAL